MSTRFADRMLLMSRAAAVLSIAVGLAVIVGWLMQAHVLKSLFLGLATMKANTAFCFVLGGVALGALSVSASRSWLPRDRSVGLGLGCAALMLLFAALILSQDLFRWNSGLDELLVVDAGSRMRGLPPGRMSPATSVSFVALGLALICITLGGRRGAALAQFLAGGVALVAVTALLGYAYDVTDLYGVWPFSSMALHTAALFLVISNGVLALAPDRGWIRELSRDTSAARMGRLLMLAVLLVPPVIGWLRMVGEQQGHYGTQFGIGLMVVCSMSILSVFVWVATFLANRSESRIVHLSRLYSVLSHINQLIVRDSEQTALLRQACEISAREGEYPLTMIVSLENGNTPPGLMACAGPDGPSMTRDRLANLLLDCAQRVGSDSRASLSAKLATILDAQGYIRIGAANGFRSTAALPLRQRNKVRAAFVFFSHEVRAFDGEEMALLREIAGDISFALDKIGIEAERKAAEESLRQLNLGLERKVAERTADLEFSNRELEAFAYSVSHDLRAPLRTIEGYASILVEDHGAALNEEARRVLGVIRRNCNWMGEMIDDLLRLSRLGRQPLNLIEVDMEEVVREAWTEACRSDQSQSRERKAPEFIAGALPSAYTDPSLVRHVWANLFLNAIKYTGKVDRPRVEVSAKTDGEIVSYSVKDNGAGFDMKYYDKLFTVFQRLHSAEEFPGSGIGLATVSRVLNRLGGRIWAEGVHGKGASFHFSLPAATKH